MSVNITLPELLNIDFPEVIDVGDGDAPLTFSATALDDVGIDRVVFYFDRDITYSFSSGSNASISSGWEEGDTASSTYTLRDVTLDGEVGLRSVLVYDVTGNRVVYEADELEEMGLPTSFEVTGGVEESAPPRLIGIDFPEVIDVGDGDAPLTFSATALDDVGIDRVVFYFDRDITYSFSSGSNASISSGWEEGDTASSTYTLRDVTLDGEVGLRSVLVYDVTGNRVIYETDELEEMGLPTSFEIWDGGPLVPELSFNASRSENSLNLEMLNEREALESGTVSGTLTFELDGATFDGVSLSGSGALSSSSVQLGSTLEITFDASLAGEIPNDSALLEFNFDLARDGSIDITEESVLLNGSNALVDDFDPIIFEVAVPLIARDYEASATEDGAEISGNVLSNDDGDDLSIVAVGESAVLDEPVEGDLGTLTLLPDGSFTYVADDATRLPEGAVGEDTFTYSVLDGYGQEATAQLRVAVSGVNDPASIAGDTTGQVVEGDPDSTQSSGVLTVTDPDAGEDRFADPDPAALAGAYGSFTFDPETGDWTYTLDNDTDAVQALPEGEEFTDSLTVTSLDGTASETIGVTVIGSSDADAPPTDREDTHAINGVAADRSGRELPGTEVVFAADDAVFGAMQTDGSGTFTLEAPAGASGQLEFARDHQPDDPAATAQDALQILRLAVGLEPSWGPAEAHDFIAADINQDGQVSAQDALDVLRNAVGLEAEHAPEWVFVDEEADLGAIARGNVDYETGVDVAAMASGLEVSMTGVLLGSMQEYT